MNEEERLGSQSIAVSGRCPFSVNALKDVLPWDIYEKQRAKAPVAWDEEMQAWVLFDFADCLAVEMDEARFRNAYQDAPQVVIDIKGGGRNITVLGGEEHAKMRRFLLSLFTPSKIAAYTKNQIAPIVSMLLDRIQSKGTGKAELCSEFSDGIPSRVILALLGMPWQDDDLVKRTLDLHEELVEVIGGAFRTEELKQKGLRVSTELNNLLLPYIRARRDDPQDDFISRVWAEAPTGLGAPMTEADALAICREVYLGGADTTVHGIANLSYLLLTNTSVRAAVEADRAQMTRAVDESMRIYGSVMYRFRIANQDAEIGGAHIRKDDRLILLHSAANRDPAKYACPEAADLGRKPPNDHLAFNKGPRSCIGVGLAKAEMSTALNAVLDRLPKLRLDREAQAPEFMGAFMRSWRPLNVLFDV